MDKGKKHTKVNLAQVKEAGAESAPNYGPAADTASSCSKCVHAQSGYCTLYDFDFESGYTCDSFATNFSATTDEGVPQVLEKYLPNKVAQYVNPYLRDIQMAHANKPLPKTLSELVAWLLSRGDVHRKMDAYYGAMNNMKEAQALPGAMTTPAGGIQAPMNNATPNLNAGGVGTTTPNIQNSFKNIADQGKRNGAAVATGVATNNGAKSNNGMQMTDDGTPVEANGSVAYGLGGNYGINVAQTESVSQGVGGQQGMTVQASSAEKSAQLQFGKPGTPGYQHNYQPQGSFEMAPGASVWTPQQQMEHQRGQFINSALQNVARSMYNQQFGHITTPQGQMINFTEGKAAAFVDGFMDKTAQYTDAELRQMLARYYSEPAGLRFNSPTDLPQYLPQALEGSEVDTGLSALGKNITAMTIAGLPTTAAGLSVGPLARLADRKSPADMEALRKHMGKANVPINPLPMPSDQGLPKWLDKLKGEGAFYNPMLDEITASKGLIKSPSVIAHELGHSRQSKPWLMANVGGKMAGGIASLLPFLTSDEDTSQTLSNVASLAYTPTVANELDASYRGYKGLRGVGRGRLGALAAFAGVPSYLAAALAPQLTHKLRQDFGTVTDKEASASTKQKKKISKVMREYKDGKLRSGSKKGPKVKNRDQAIAIALSEAGVSKK